VGNQPYAYLGAGYTGTHWGALRTDSTAQVIIAGHAFVQNLRRGHYELAIGAPPATRVAAAFAELARAI
jgi:hypothetical protein